MNHRGITLLIGGVNCLGVDEDHRGAGPARVGGHQGPVPHQPARRPQDRAPEGEYY